MAKDDKKSKKKDKKDKGSKKDKKQKKQKTSNTEFEITKYSGSIALSKLKHVMMTKKGKKGKKIKGLFIPLKENYLVEGDEGAVYMNVNVIAKSPQDDFGQNGFISQNGNKKWSEASEEEQDAFKALPILGNIKNFEDSKGGNDTSGKQGDQDEYDEEDDLPF